MKGKVFLVCENGEEHFFSNYTTKEELERILYELWEKEQDCRVEEKESGRDHTL